MNTNQKGTIAELHVAAMATDRGYHVSFPAGDCPYDLIIDKHGQLFRVQVKHVSHQSNPDVLRIMMGDDAASGRKGYTRDTIDAIVLYDSENNKAYWVPVDEIEGKTSLSLRLTEPKNNQKTGIKYAHQYFRW